MTSLIPIERLNRFSPNPLPFVNVRNPELVSETRQLNCRQYNACLTITFRRDWEGFHCGDCQCFSPYPIVMDYDGCSELLQQLSNLASFSKTDDEVILALGLSKKDI
jgi:hypothetical protein